MKKSRALSLGFVVAAALVCAPTGSRAQSAADRGNLARKLVQSAAIREGDLVQITGGMRDLELLEDIAVEARMVGAHPLLTLGTDRLLRKMIEKVPARYDSQTPGFNLKLAEAVSAQIVVDFNEDPGLFAKLPAARRAALTSASQPVGALVLKRNVRQLFLGNGLYPTAKMAARFGMTQDALSKVFWEGVSVDYGKLQATGENVRKVLASGRELHITNPNGTDLRVRIEGRRVLVSDGVISPDEERAGGPACSVWLPAGEVYVAPVPGTAEGKVVVERQELDGAEIEGLTFTFQAGKLTSMTAKAGLAPFKALYDAAGDGKEALSFIDVGINPNVRIPPGSRLTGFMPAGMVTVGMGYNLWAGGDNSATFASTSFLPGSTLTVDGTPLVENGALKY